ncbi:methyltransferase domain-containing protein [Microaerobacter geothermalis]|uniref:class I SAM-dependent methyltransferase n=1 Tax=Microaerobacter geothermalis TaxID=674972 RepID=UPI001F308EE8|nr:methyltransferase domain-containing protein [Microaerobacter geothermalis]MCF6094462.1 methyltransferase domain-containing protein [Microaerobacter geothermalis]
MDKRFNPEHIHKLDNPERKKYLPPEAILHKLDLSEEDVFIDLGAGTGYFTIPAANVVKNKIVALDVEPKMLAAIKVKADKMEARHIEYLESPVESIRLGDSIADKALASFILHEVDDLNQTLVEIKRVLKPLGKLLILEWKDEEMDQGPPLSHRIGQSEVKNVLKQSGYQVEQVFYPNPMNYGIVARSFK